MICTTGKQAQQIILTAGLSLMVPTMAFAQAGRNAASDTGLKPVTLPVILEAAPEAVDQQAIASKKMELYDGGYAQQIAYFRRDYSAAKIVVLIDNTETFRASFEEMTEAVNALAANLYQGDEMMIVGYDEQPEIIEEFTADREKVKLATSLFRKKGSPRLSDALQATINDVFRLQAGLTKRVIILVSDGYDWESRTGFRSVLDELARENIVVYVLQAPDRTQGAPRRRSIKPVEFVNQLTRRTAGRIFPLHEAQEAARVILQELSERWFQLSYKPTRVDPYSDRRLLIIADGAALSFRTKLEQPGQPYK